MIKRGGVFILACVMAYPSFAAVRRRKKFKRDAAPLAVIYDDAPLSESPLEKNEELPLALKGPISEGSQEGPKAAGQADLRKIRELLKNEAYLDALATLKLYMSVQKNFKMSEQVRLWLLRSKLEARVANWAQARAALSFAQTLIESEAARSQENRKRVYALAQLKSHADLVEEDLKRRGMAER